MPLPQGPLPAGTRISLLIEVLVLRDDGEQVEVSIPDGNGGARVQLVSRAALDSGEVVGG